MILHIGLMKEKVKMDTEKLRKLINESGYKTSFVAEYCGIHAQTLRSIMSGGSNPSRSVVKLLALLLKVDESELILDKAS